MPPEQEGGEKSENEDEFAKFCETPVNVVAEDTIVVAFKTDGSS